MKSKHTSFFQIVGVTVFCLFIVLMIFVTVVAYSHRSGVTGMDMGKVQKMRYDQSSRKS